MTIITATKDFAPVRCFFVGATQHDVERKPGGLRDWLAATKVERFDSVTGKESWFYFFNSAHMRGFIAHSDTVLQGLWDGPGWYHTSMRRVKGKKWLVFNKGCIFEAFHRRFTLTDADRARFDSFVNRLKKKS